MNIAFLTSAHLPQGTPADAILKSALESSKHKVSFAIWSDESMNWAQFDKVVIRSPWDYYRNLPAFLRQIEKISSATKLINSQKIVSWNSSKEYLIELQNKNLSVVPSFLADELDLALRAGHLLLKKEKCIVVKPTVSAAAHLTFKITDENEIESAIQKILDHSQVILQPFMRSVPEDGEISLIFFRDKNTYAFSHSVLKTAKSGDYRVQSEHGGDIESFTPRQDMIDLGLKALSHLPEPASYARIDIVDWRYYSKIGEIELIEPQLFFLQAPESTAPMIRAIEAS